MDKSASVGVPYFASSIIASSYKLVSIFVEAAISKRKYMSLQFFY